MSCKKILRNSYIPTKPRFFNEHDKGDLDTQLKQMTYNEILQNPEEHFEKRKIITFDLIHKNTSEYFLVSIVKFTQLISESD